MSNKLAFVITSSLITSFATFMSPLYSLIFWLFYCEIFDFITGIWAAKKQGIKLESHKMRKSATKTAMYMAVIFMGHGVDLFVLPDPLTGMGLAKYITSVWCGFEAYSILENAYAITGARVFWALTQLTTKKMSEHGIEIKKEKE